MSLSNIIAEIADERLRQVQEEGWSPEHDDEHANGELAKAAAAYAYVAWLPDHLRKYVSGIYSFSNDATIRDLWPWEAKWWKPKNPRADLVRAGALIVAEIERLDRASAETVVHGAAE